jgi:hypothetical protein
MKIILVSASHMRKDNDLILEIRALLKEVCILGFGVKGQGFISRDADAHKL